MGWTEVLWVMIDKLGEIYLSDKHTMAYMAFKDFYSYKRTAGLNINDARGVMVIVAGYGHGDTSSNPGPDWLHFT